MTIAKIQNLDNFALSEATEALAGYLNFEPNNPAMKVAANICISAYLVSLEKQKDDTK